MTMMSVNSLLNNSPPIPQRLASISEQRGSSSSASPENTADTPSTMQESTPSRRSSEIQTPPQRQPIRSRTPWDGDGYSLSRAQDKAGTPSEMTPAVADMPSSQSPQSQAQTPYSRFASSPPRHRTSDSQESQNSFSSAYTGPSPIHSNAHSRMSSLTTVPETSSQLYTPPECANSGPAFSDSVRPWHGEILQSYFTERHQSDQGYQRYSTHSSHEVSEPNNIQLLRDIENLQNETRMLRMHQLPLRNRSLDSHDLPPSTPQLPWELATADAHFEDRLERPPGPTTAGRNLHPETLLHASLHSSAPQTHRRVVSAPHFTLEPTPSHRIPNPMFGPVPEPTPPRSSSSNRAMTHHPGLAVASQTPLSSHLPNATGHPSLSQVLTLESPRGHRRRSSIDSDGSIEVPDHLVITLTDHEKCFFMENCATKSAPRKAISHVFGRNKLCTRDIIEHVWVYYCRKHYQRTRYRNGVEYPQHQIELVRKQIQRVQKWSDGNKARGRGRILIDWLLSLRKREKDRLQKLEKSAGRKRSFDEHGKEDPDPDSDGEGSVATHVPPWLLALVGQSFDSPGMLRLVDEIHREINSGRLTQIPDIEILPNILKDVSDEEEDDAKKTHKRRSTNTNNIHRRTKSAKTSATRSGSMLGAPSSSQPSNASNTVPSQIVTATYSHQQNQQHQPYQSQHEPADMWQRMDSNSSGYTQDSPGFGEHYSAHPASRYDVPGHSLHGAPGPLGLHERHHSMGFLQAPALTGHGSLGGPSSSRRIELPPMSNYDRHGQRPHQRSYSEAGSFQQQGRHRLSANLAHPGYMEQEPRDPYHLHQGRPTSSGYGDEHIRLPPLHAAVGMHPSPSPLDRTAPLVGVSHAAYQSRQQSSPTSTRLPATMEGTSESEIQQTVVHS